MILLLEATTWWTHCLKSYLQTNPEGTPNMVTASDAMVPTDETMFYPVINFYLAITAQIRQIAKERGINTTRLDKLTRCRPFDNPSCDPLYNTESAGLTMARTCDARMDFQAAGVSESIHSVLSNNEEASLGVAIQLHPSGWGLLGHGTGESEGAQLSISSQVDPIRLHHPYYLLAAQNLPSGYATMSYMVLKPTGGVFCGPETSNPARSQLVFTSCQINERMGGGFGTAGLNEPWIGTLKGFIVGKLECLHVVGSNAWTTYPEMNGNFTWPFIAAQPGTQKHLDLICHGGSEKNKDFTP